VAEVASLLVEQARSMSLLAHLEELRKRIVFSVFGVMAGCLSYWSFADRIFGLMQQPIIGALHHHGIGGGLVYLNPTEPFNLYLEVALLGGLFAASPFVFYQLWLFIAPGLYRTVKRYVLHCGHRHTHRRHPQHVSFRRSDGCALRRQYGSSSAGQFQAQPWSGRRVSLRSRSIGGEHV
jgi:hypothetical protein